jgi:zinc/manganese transport system permease protein
MANPSFSPDLLYDLRQLFAFPFMVNAIEAGTLVAIMAAVVGWYMVLRRQAFAGHTLAVMSFPGVAGAALAGLPGVAGYYVACVGAALAMGGSGPARRTRRTETASIGTIQTVGLAAGFLFLSLNQHVLGGPETLLFGTFLGVTKGQVLALLGVAVLVVLLIAVAARPLLLATIDPELAEARGVAVGWLNLGFLLVLGLAVAATSQITGALLVFALLVAPPAAAQLITLRPLPGVVLSVVFALLIVWLGLAAAYFSPYPVGFFITTFALVVYLLAALWRWVR